MSLILEALRKSEAERRRGSTPDVAMELPPAARARPRATPSWLLPALVFGVMALLAGGWWMRREAPATGTAPAATAATPDPADSVAPAIVRRIQRQAATTPTAIKPPPAAPPVAPPVAVPSQPAPAMVEPAPPPARPLPPPPAAPVPTAPAATDPRAIADIDATSIPPVKLSMHMWDESPSRRFVILDGQRMGEGDRNGEVTVLSIERDGVVVERNGQRARVPLP